MATAQEVTESGQNERPPEDPNLALVNEVQDALLGSELHHGRSNDGLGYQIAGMLRESGYTGQLDLTKIDRKRLDLAIQKLTELREPVAEAHEQAETQAADLRRRIDAILDTDRGAQVNKAREVFKDFEDQIENECQVPTTDFQGISLDDYRFSGYPVSMEELDEEEYDSNTIYALNISHLELWGDDYDYGGGNTELTLKLNDAGDIEYKFDGDELDDDFKLELVRSILKTAEPL